MPLSLVPQLLQYHDTGGYHPQIRRIVAKRSIGTFAVSVDTERHQLFTECGGETSPLRSAAISFISQTLSGVRRGRAYRRRQAGADASGEERE